MTKQVNSLAFVRNLIESNKMSHWNYRICRHPDGHLSINEVHYDDDGRPCGMTAEPINFVVDKEEGPEELTKAIEMALEDIKNNPIFEIPKNWK